jgi:ubiquinone/menaquinone biosynthesis C-methylase UbiE
MEQYYEDRAAEYETVYAKPERQNDLVYLKTWLAKAVEGRNVLEVAAGTGYWTAVAAGTARNIVATDINKGPLGIARGKELGQHVRFVLRDAYALEGLSDPVSAGFDAGMAMFWWSHVAKADQARFLAGWARVLAPGARILMIDNRYVPGSSTPISRRDEFGNTYQRRHLADGAIHEIVKNFPDRADIGAALSDVAEDIEFEELDYFWLLSARAK